MNKKKTGPKPDNIKIEGGWKAAMGKAIKKERPKDGWPKSSDKDSEKEKTNEKDNIMRKQRQALIYQWFA